MALLHQTLLNLPQGHGVTGPGAVCGLCVDVSDRVGDAAAGHAEQVGEYLVLTLAFYFRLFATK